MGASTLHPPPPLPEGLSMLTSLPGPWCHQCCQCCRGVTEVLSVTVCACVCCGGGWYFGLCCHLNRMVELGVTVATGIDSRGNLGTRCCHSFWSCAAGNDVGVSSVLGPLQSISHPPLRYKDIWIALVMFAV